MNILLFKDMISKIESFGKLIGDSVSPDKEFYKLTYQKHEINIVPVLDDTSLKNISIDCLYVGNEDKKVFGYKYISINEIEEILKNNNSETISFLRNWLFGCSYREIKPFLHPQDVSLKSENIKDKTNSFDRSSLYYKYSDILNRRFNDNFEYFKKGKYFSNVNNDTCIIFLYSKRYETRHTYWYSYHRYQMELAAKYKKAFLLLAFKDSDDFVLLPIELVNEMRSTFGHSGEGEGIYWHLYISEHNHIYNLRRPHLPDFDLQPYVVRLNSSSSQFFEDPKSFEECSDLVLCLTGKKREVKL